MISPLKTLTLFSFKVSEECFCCFHSRGKCFLLPSLVVSLSLIILLNTSGLAEAGLISSKLSRKDMLSSIMDEDDSAWYFFPERCVFADTLSNVFFSVIWQSNNFFKVYDNLCPTIHLIYT